MARPHVRLVLLTLVAVLTLVGVTGASASAPTTASGTFKYTGEATSCRPAGGNTICEFPDTVVTYTGTFDGTSTGRTTLTIHADGSANFHDVYIFTGTVNGIPGTVTFEATGAGTSDLHFKGTLTSIRGTAVRQPPRRAQAGRNSGRPSSGYLPAKIHIDPIARPTGQEAQSIRRRSWLRLIMMQHASW